MSVPEDHLWLNVNAITGPIFLERNYCLEFSIGIRITRLCSRDHFCLPVIQQEADKNAKNGATNICICLGLSKQPRSQEPWVKGEYQPEIYMQDMTRETKKMGRGRTKRWLKLQYCNLHEIICFFASASG